MGVLILSEMAGSANEMNESLLINPYNFEQIGEEFTMLDNVKKDWMEKIHPALKSFVDRTPGSFIEEKNYPLACHYRNTDPDFWAEKGL